MNNLARQVFDLRAQLWQLADNDQLPTPADADRLAVVHQIDYHLHTVEGLLRTLGAPMHLHTAPEGAPGDADSAPETAGAPALHPHTPESPAPGAPDPQAHALALAEEVRRRTRARKPAARIAQVLESAAAGIAPSRIARDQKLSYDSVTRWIHTAETLRNT
ncbi:hypothetical protein ACIG56_34450 [Nocardia fusca]|uniref:hypothetical protein n=1 Tax=Nocardia fusca TaxID=941183 RepID=UPI0037C7BFD2